MFFKGGLDDGATATVSLCPMVLLKGATVQVEVFLVSLSQPTRRGLGLYFTRAMAMASARTRDRTTARASSV